MASLNSKNLHIFSMVAKQNECNLYVKLLHLIFTYTYTHAYIHAYIYAVEHIYLYLIRLLFQALWQLFRNYPFKDTRSGCGNYRNDFWLLVHFIYKLHQRLLLFYIYTLYDLIVCLHGFNEHTNKWTNE